MTRVRFLGYWLGLNLFYNWEKLSFFLRRGFLRLSRVLLTSRVFTSGYVNTETVLHFFNIKLKDRGIILWALFCLIMLCFGLHKFFKILKE